MCSRRFTVVLVESLEGMLDRTQTQASVYADGETIS
jgi:hypothetical protein